jgi:hypothetical protein
MPPPPTIAQSRLHQPIDRQWRSKRRHVGDVRPLLIHTERDLMGLMRSESLLHPFRKQPALLAIPQLQAGENAAWSQRLEYFRQQCGCVAAMIGLSIFMLGCFIHVLVVALQTNPANEPDYRAVLFNGASFFVGLMFSALLGKLVGLTFANLRFRQTCRALQFRLMNLQ